MNPAKVGKVLALVSPALAVGVVCFMLFATGYMLRIHGQTCGSS
jgi:hypothetical protein